MLAVAAVLAATVIVQWTANPAFAQGPAGARRFAAGGLTAAADLQRLDATVESLAAAGQLRAATGAADRDLPGRTHQYFQQFHGGVPVLGGGVSRQQAGGATVSLFGAVADDIDVDTMPRFGSARALELLEAHSGSGALGADLPELLILPLPDARHILVYAAVMDDLQRYYLDAHSGSLVHRESILRREAAVGSGAGILGQQKKLSVRRTGGPYEARDELRPAEIITLDARFDLLRVLELLVGSGAVWGAGDVASDADNVWDDPAVVDSHAYLGATYDYFYAAHDWRGIDGADSRIFSIVNLDREFDNAFYAPPPLGPEGGGVMAFGELPDGTPLAALDVVGHEYTHGVTDHVVQRRTGQPLRDGYDGVLGPSSFTVDGVTHRCGQVYTWTDDRVRPFVGRRYSFQCADGRYALFMNVGGSVHEAWADVLGTAVEWRQHDPPRGPLRADYDLGEDTASAIRSMSNPRSHSLDVPPQYGFQATYPDAESGTLRFLIGVFENSDQFFVSSFWTVDRGQTVHWLPSDGYDGTHWNSTVYSHAFYLAVEGGRNTTTGLAVEGVGGSRRHEIERVFFRVIERLLPPRPSERDVPAALRQAAIDLYGAGSTTYRAMDQALNAVGLPLAPVS